MKEINSANVFASKRRVLMAAIVATLLAVSLLQVFENSDTVFADETPGINNIRVSVFDQNSEDYGELVYVSDLLPESLNATEWVKDSASGFWYNVNTLSTDFGKILTCGKIPTLSDDEIRGDIISKYPIFIGDFVLVQVTYDVAYDCNISIKITKDGMPDFTDSYKASLSVGGCRSESSVVHTDIYTVEATNGDLKPAEPRGDYVVSVAYNGIATGNVTVPYKGADFSVLGRVVDASGKGIPGASISYKIGNTQNTVISDSTGVYTIFTETGSIVSVDGITADGYTFGYGFPYVYGTVIGNVAPGPSFAANESSVQVTVKDQSGRPAVGAHVKAEWHYIRDGNIVKDPTGFGFPSDYTDSEGKLSIIYSSVPVGAMMYIYGVDEVDSYSFDADAVPDTASSLPALTKEGNVYLDPLIDSNAALKVMEHSVDVTTKGNVDSSSAGGAILPGVSVTAEWYYQKEIGVGDYQISTLENIEAGTFLGLNEGKAWELASHSDDSGKITIVYKKPEWSIVAGESAFLYIYCNGLPSNTSSDLYTFENPGVISDGDSITDQTSAFGGCRALESSSIPNETSVSAKQVAYLITGTVTGSVPDSITVFCLSATTGDVRTASEVAGIITFAFPVMEGWSCKIDIDPVAGYTFTNNGITLPSAMGDQTYSSVAASVDTSCKRSAPVVIGTYTITGLSAGDKAKFEYGIAGTDVSTVVMSSSDSASLSVYGRTGNVVSSIKATGVGDVYIPDFTGNTVAASRDIEKKLIVYYDGSSGPAIDNVRAGQTIDVYCNGVKSTSGVSDTDGIITAVYPDVSDVVFKIGELTLSSSEITSGVYKGFMGINLYEAVPPAAAKTVDLTIRYVASSSMENQDTPTVVDILNPDPSVPVVRTFAVGSTETFNAPGLEGFRFSGWYLDGVCVSNRMDCELTITENMVGATLTASYGAVTPEPPPQDITTVLAIGMVSITIALLAFVYVILQVRRY